jgi:hypothetical protein
MYCIIKTKFYAKCERGIITQIVHEILERRHSSEFRTGNRMLRSHRIHLTDFTDLIMHDI